MRSKILALALALAAGTLSPAQWTLVYNGAPNSAIPSNGTGGAAGGCSNAANMTSITVNAPDAYTATNVYVHLHLDHTWAHDLRITLIHGGTSVTLFDQYPTTFGKAFSGHYNFKDDAPATIAASVNPNLPALVGGYYQPSSPLSAFDGMNSFGPWTLEFCDLAGSDVGVLHAFDIVVTTGNLFQQSFQPFVPIPDAGAGGCIGPVTHVFNVPPGAGPVTDLMVGFLLGHPRAADLELTVTHGPVSVTLCSPNTPSSTIALSGGYYFDDGAWQSWDQGLATWNFYLPTDSYRPDSPLSAFDGIDSAGPWFFTVCDSVAGNAGGGVTGLELQFLSAAYRFDVLQPSGSSSIILANSGGNPGNHYLNAFTIVPGSFPAGWLNGLDISMSELANQIAWGAPFFGTLGANGGASLVIPGPIPSNLNLQFVSFELAPDYTLLNAIPARSHLTAP